MGYSGTNWYHLKCFTVPDSIESVKDLDGYSKLKPADKKLVEAHFTAAFKTNSKKRKEREDDVEERVSIWSAAWGTRYWLCYWQAAKRQKTDDAERQRVEQLWKIKDKLKKKYNTNELKAILKYARWHSRYILDDTYQFWLGSTINLITVVPRSWSIVWPTVSCKLTKKRIINWMDSMPNHTSATEPCPCVRSARKVICIWTPVRSNVTAICLPGPSALSLAHPLTLKSAPSGSIPATMRWMNSSRRSKRTRTKTRLLVSPFR